MKKSKRKLKVEFPVQKIQRESKEDSKKTSDVEEKNELEELILDEPPRTPISRETISPTLELAESILEAQLQNTPITENKENTPQNQLYESIKYAATMESSYQQSSYNSADFASSSPSLDFSPQQDFSRNPLTGFRQANPF